MCEQAQSRIADGKRQVGGILYRLAVDRLKAKGGGRG